MRRTAVLLTVLALASLVSANQASALGWRGLWRGARYPTCNWRSYAVATSHVEAPAQTATSVSESLSVTVISHKKAPAQTATPAREYRSLDERRCAELGPDRCRMVYPEDGETEPYPACKAWKWDDEDGWGWDWSESNCPWRQLRHSLLYDYD